MKRVLSALVLATAVILGASPLPASAGQDKITIGVMNDMSSVYSYLGGMGSVAATKMAIADFGGKVLGKPIEVVFADHQNKADVGVSLASRWFDSEGVDAIVDLPTS